MEHEILSWNAFALVFKLTAYVSHQQQKLYLQRKTLSDSENSIALNFNGYYMLLVKQNKKNSKRRKRVWMKLWLKNRNYRSARDNIFSELLLTEKFRHYLQMNATSHYWLYLDFYTFTFWYYLHFYLYSMPWLFHSYIHFYNSLQYTIFIFTNTSSLLRN